MAKLNILYASEMGNAVDVADNIYLRASEQGIDAEQFEMNDVSMEDLQDMTKVLVVTSSTGDGDLPMMGEDFWDVLSQTNINLEGLEYSVCALGDRSYFNFCGAGKKVDARMSKLGAKRVADRQDCDRDIVGADEWAETAIENLGF
jgi:sulfite reductase (NADPH) flavoprotein alpha-component